MGRITVDDNLIEHLLSLSMLSIEKSEYDRFRAQIQKILDYIGMLDEVNTDGVSPMFGGIECPSVLRLDITQEGLARTSALMNAPSEKEGLFEIPKVIE
ncbi:MAG: Asp-tRNA(Asn)/Glu-tRNA(Gln) amidotransferase subunit GatC [Deltaproteobacteria bacterium]|nr:Asp-tRNA(Asn)/Glu-tRNA(Gln) amidotransferase subunit GatC [Deltaproteobacteria bacterium]